MPRTILLAIAAAITLAGCSAKTSTATTEAQPNPLGSEAVATVNGAPIAASLMNPLALQAAQRSVDSLTDDQKAQLVQQLIMMRLLADAANQEGLEKDQGVAAQIELQRMQLLARAVTEHFRAENPPTEAELRDAYEKNLPRYLATQYKARHILVPTKEEAEEIIDELDNGADFAELARKKSTGPTGPRGGELDWFTADSMVAPFAEAVKNAEIGVYTPEPVQTQFGWHVILVEDKREQQAPGLEAVRDELISIVEREKLNAYLDSLRTSAKIDMTAPNSPTD